MLVAIAILPMACPRWFHFNRNKAIISFVLGVPTLVYLLTRFGHTGLELAAETAEEYVSFIILLFVLYTVSGGIYLTGNIIATPRHNLGFLATGAVLASLIGTMGASMVLIRPLIRANSERKYQRHTVIFFIFAVSNLGGLLTPLGDPPLFLGFLRGVPFGWTLHLWAEWLLTVGLTLLVYMAVELRYYRREPREALRRDLAVTVLLSGIWARAGEAIHFPFVREVILVLLALFSLYVCPRGPRAANSFNWGPIVEVAVVFAGIFATMIPALALLQANGASIGITQPWQYFWGTGGLSAFLDNAPTYLTFASVAQGQVGAATVGALTAPEVVAGLGYSAADFLRAISCGAVMMGALTYIGNAPNFAVKCIAEHQGLKMPTFFHFMGYSVVMLGPILALVTVIFLL
jgi:Na+/H+ antiporter NhaD/arsenite permease-like protein